MTRLLTGSSGLCVLLALYTPELFAQHINLPPGKPYPRPALSADEVQALARREMVVAEVGASAGAFVEAQGEEAVAALVACSKPVAVQLAEFHASGDLSKLPRPRDLLRVIARFRPADEVVLWAIQHVRELTDLDSFEAYCFEPLAYTRSLKQLSDGAVEARARRLRYQNAVALMEAVRGALAGNDWKGPAIVIGLLGLVGLVIWARRRRQAA